VITVKKPAGFVLVTPGEWWDAMAQTLIDANATEATPLKLGNVHFFRAEGRTCYLEPVNTWDATAVSDALCEEILKQRGVTHDPQTPDVSNI
jgi:hypothetical protein